MLPGSRRRASPWGWKWNMSQQPMVNDVKGEPAGDGTASVGGTAHPDGRLSRLMRTVAARPRLVTLSGIALLAARVALGPATTSAVRSSGAQRRADLELVGSHTFDCGVMYLRYRVAH